MLKKCLRINTTKTTSAKMEAATGKNTWVPKKKYLGSEENIKTKEKTCSRYHELSVINIQKQAH